jgi:hypothetical protein
MYAILAITIAVNIVIIITVHYVNSAPNALRKHGRCRSVRTSGGALKLSAYLAHYFFILLPSVRIRAIVNNIPIINPNQNGLTYIIFTS